MNLQKKLVERSKKFLNEKGYANGTHFTIRHLWLDSEEGPINFSVILELLESYESRDQESNQTK